MDANGGNLLNLTQSAEIEANPSWSPDGTHLVFEKWTGGPSDFTGVELFSVKADGSDLTQLTTNTQMDYLSAWSPDGQKIAFEVYTAAGKQAICVMDIASSNIITVTDASYHEPDEAYWLMWQGEPPAWSPDSTQLAFVSKLGENHEIYAVNADGSGLTNLTLSDADEKRLVWSPDGGRIAFAGMRDGNPEIYVMDADGTHLTRLTENPAADSFPSWSPDGSRIAFWSERETHRGIYIMNSDGGNVRRLTSLDSETFFPRWGP